MKLMHSVGKVPLKNGCVGAENAPLLRHFKPLTAVTSVGVWGPGVGAMEASARVGS